MISPACHCGETRKDTRRETKLGDKAEGDHFFAIRHPVIEKHEPQELTLSGDKARQIAGNLYLFGFHEHPRSTLHGRRLTVTFWKHFKLLSSGEYVYVDNIYIVDH